MEYEAVIGLEVHAQLRTESKIFCSCRSSFGDEPNANGCPVCLGLPGALPVLNRRAVDMAILMGLAVNCTISRKSIFARKNYFYPDLPKGYQISQYDMPLCEHGSVPVEVGGATKMIGITRIHLEEDAGKLIHDQGDVSLFDVNRCGTPLIEIVTEPDLRSAAEAYAYLVSLKQILQYLGICDCNMEEGSLRCDANISLRPRGREAFGTKTELKNMNSFRGVEKGLAYEIGRQRRVLEAGGTVEQETYLWDAERSRTTLMRTKESAHDYRYFPEPDLVPLVVDDARIEEIGAGMPELPAVRKQRMIETLGLVGDHAVVLTDTREVADYFEAVLVDYANARGAATWVMGEVLRLAKEVGKPVDELTLTPSRLAALLAMVDAGEISAQAAKRVLPVVEERDADPSAVVEELGLKQISDSSALRAEVENVLRESPDEVRRFKEGEKKLRGYFVGQVMKATGGKANPREVNNLLGELLA